MKILYCCPFAHYSGHHPHVSVIEPEALQNAGHGVTLLTFCGLIDDIQPKVSQIKVVNHGWKYDILHKIRQKTLPRWFLMLYETFVTLRKAVKLYKEDNYDVIHLRDGDPFLFVSFMMPSAKWVVSALGSVVYAPKTTFKDWVNKPFLAIYSLALSFIGGGIWKPLYRNALNSGNYVLIVQNDRALNGFKTYLGGVFEDYVYCIPRGVEDLVTPMDKNEAKVKVGSPDKYTVLSFGAPHQGKNMDVIFHALKDLDVHLVHGGVHTYSLGGSPAELAGKYGVSGKCTIHDRFIGQEDKPMFFGCADVAILSYTRVFASTSSVLLECCKFGLPVIASNNHPLGDDVLKYKLGMTFEAEDVESLVATIKLFQLCSKKELAIYKTNCLNYAVDRSIRRWAMDCGQMYGRLHEKTVIAVT